MEHRCDTRVLKTDLLEIWNKIKYHLQQGSVEGSDSKGYLNKQFSLNHALSLIHI